MLLIIFEKISTEEKSIHIIQFLGEKADWESWSKKFLSCGKHERYKKILISSGYRTDFDKIPKQEENALDDELTLTKKHKIS